MTDIDCPASNPAPFTRRCFRIGCPTSLSRDSRAMRQSGDTQRVFPWKCRGGRLRRHCLDEPILESSRRRPGPIPRNVSMAFAGRRSSQTTPCDYGSGPSPGRPGERPCAVILAARFARALPLTLSLSHEERAGKTGWPLHPGLSRRKKLRKRESTGTGGDHTGLPCAMVLRLIRDLPGEPCRLPPSAAMRLRIVGISASLGGARTTRFRRPRPRRSSTGTSASTASRLACRDDRDTPLRRSRQDGAR